MARIPPIPPSQWTPEMREALTALVPPRPLHPRPIQEGRPKGLNALGSFAHHPELARAFFTFNGHVLMATTLTLRQRELLILRVATLRSCSYEWAQHLVVGRDVGLDDEEIGRISRGPDAPCWNPLEAALLRAVDELIGDGVISDATWTVLSGELDERQLMDVIFTVGAYETIAWLFRSLDLDLDADLRRAGSHALGQAPTPGAGQGHPADRLQRPASSSGSAERPALSRLVVHAESMDDDQIKGTAALIKNDAGQYLLHLRDDIPNICDPGAWSLLGGDREPGESPEDAIRRELAEEAALHGLDLTRFTVAHCTGPDGCAKGRIHVFSGTWNGDPDTLPLTEGIMLRWFAPAALPRLRMSAWARASILLDQERKPVL